MSSQQAEQDLHRSRSPAEESVYAEASQLLAPQATVAERDASDTSTSPLHAGPSDCPTGEERWKNME